MKLNTKGFTLIEIMVTLVISSIIMLVAGSIILNSFGYFDKTDRANIDKLATDKIASLVRDELAYASRVVVSEKRPEESGDWYALSVNEDGHLLKTSYIGGEETTVELYNEDFYNNRTLDLKARCYKDDYRMDLSFAFLNQEKEQTYKTSITLELINMKSKTSEKSTKSDVYSNMSDISNESKIKIFYQNGLYPYINEEKKDDGSGTVEDEINCKNALNDKGLWVAGKTYLWGDFVYLVDKDDATQKIWYRLTAVKYSTANPPNTTWQWKKIEKYFDTNPSLYLKGDVIILDHLYYQAKLNTERSPKEVPSHWSVGYKNIGDLRADDDYVDPDYSECVAGSITCKLVLKTVEDEICEMSPIVSEPSTSVSSKPADSTNNIGDFQSNFDKFGSDIQKRWYYIGDFVSFNGAYYRYVSEFDGRTWGIGSTPGIASSGTKKIDINWTTKSAYEAEDVIKYNGNFYRAKSFIQTSLSDPITSISILNENVWEEVVPNATNDAWVTK